MRNSKDRGRRAEDRKKKEVEKVRRWEGEKHQGQRAEGRGQKKEKS